MQPSGPALVSGEGVRLALSPAGVGSRVIAAALDAVLEVLALFLLTLLDVELVGNADGAALGAVILSEVVLVVAGYPILAEWLTRGRTVGKAALGLRVVRDDGGPIGLRQALVRGVAGLVLEKPGLVAPLTTIAGLAVLSSSAREKRIGDMMAGTVVLNERSAQQDLASLPDWVPVPLQPWVLSADLHRLDDRLALSARQFISRAHAMTLGAQIALGEDLRRRVVAVIAPPPPPGTPTPVLLMSVLAERRRRAYGAAAPPPVSPPRPPPALRPPSGPAIAAGPADGSPFAPPR